jgi:hypothetical protein
MEAKMEKVINEFKVVETDDGFRIEIKGDKVAIRRMMGGDFGPHFFRGKKRHFRGPGFGFGFGPRFWAGFSDWCGPWGDWEEEDKEGQQRSA